MRLAPRATHPPSPDPSSRLGIAMPKGRSAEARRAPNLDRCDRLDNEVLMRHVAARSMHPGPRSVQSIGRLAVAVDSPAAGSPAAGSPAAGVFSRIAEVPSVRHWRAGIPAMPT